MTLLEQRPAESLPDDVREQPRQHAGSPRGRRRWRMVVARLITALAALLVLLALLAPNQTTRLAPGAFVGIPVEALLGVVLVLVLPAKPRRVVATLLGAVLGLLVLVKIVDMGFYKVLDRPFDPTTDWTLFAPAAEAVERSVGRAGAIGGVITAAVSGLAALVFVTLAVLRLTRVTVRHRTAAVRTVAVLGLAWATCAALGVQIVPGVPVASRGTSALAYEHALQVRAGLADQKEFAAELAVDAFRNTPADRLLTALRGKDVIFAFVESYGRDAVKDPTYAGVGAVLDAGNQRLRAAGFTSRTAFLTSPTAGGNSWLAHATLFSGLWINNQQRYNDLMASDRFTLNSAFQRADWRTVGVHPAITRSWPEGAFYRYDGLYTAENLGYRGPRFSFSAPPDQYTLSAFQRTERTAPGRGPVMAEVALMSGHVPWVPLPRLIGWDQVGDGAALPVATAGDPDAVMRDPKRARVAYRQAMEYSLSTILSYVETYGDDDLVVVFLGDHQPPIVTGEIASRDVPITIVARDPAVMARTSGWGWQDGIKPSAQAPVWRMDAFRDRFLTAFGS